MAARDTRAIIEVLGGIQEELAADFPHHARRAASLAGAVGRDFEAAAKQYCSGDWWGTMGSMFDVSPADTQQNQKLMSLLVRLVDEFEALGINCPQAAARAKILRTWTDNK